MKFLCIECDTQMAFEERQQPGDGTFGAAFRCPSCKRSIAMLANPMETQLVESLGVKIGGRTLDEQPMEIIRGSMLGREDAFTDAPPSAARARPRWTPESEERLGRVPSFVRGMVKRIYLDYAVEHGIVEITPAVMDRARTELGLEGM
jgi:hypothetical protein